MRKSASARRAGAALAACAYLLAIIGFPVWEPLASTGERFACEHRRCGCRSAQQCWTSCCCFTLAERIAWAKANNAEVPAHALVRASSATCDSSLATGDSPVAKAKSCGQCCAPKSTKGRVVWVDSAQAQRCKGVANGWMTLGMPVFPPPQAVALEIEFLPIGHISLADVREVSRSDRPATRPG